MIFTAVTLAVFLCCLEVAFCYPKAAAKLQELAEGIAQGVSRKRLEILREQLENVLNFEHMVTVQRG